MSKALDYIFGDETVAYDRKRLMELVKMTTTNANGDQPEEVRIALGAFEMVCSFSSFMNSYISHFRETRLSRMS